MNPSYYRWGHSKIWDIFEIFIGIKFRYLKLYNFVFQENSVNKPVPLSWFDAKSFCNKEKSVLYDKATLTSDIKDSWIGISRGYAYINSESK